MKVYGIDAVPFAHEKIEEWRDALRRGVSTLHKPTNLFVRGGIDDVWASPKGELFIVDYKATSKDGQITLDDEWKIQYKRQMEIYQWLFRQNGFKVSATGYFVYVNGKTDRKSFDGKLEFDVAVIPYKGSDKWIDKTLKSIKECLMQNKIPSAGDDCEFCSYIELVETEVAPGTSAKSKTVNKGADKSAGARKKTGDANQNLF